ncbi:Uncharacterised protein [Achromobacter xylosoxidans]|nr:Uncharacterised protein [Achromobacter xylosoxidans]
MPKSSIDRRTPRRCSSAIVRSVPAVASSTTPSVISSIRSDAASPNSASVAAIIRGRFRLWKLVADRFTDTDGTRNPLLRQIDNCEQASRTAQSPRSPISPHSSASGTNRAGEISPSVGWRQRASASTPYRLPFFSPTCGW